MKKKYLCIESDFSFTFFLLLLPFLLSTLYVTLIFTFMLTFSSICSVHSKTSRGRHIDIHIYVNAHKLFKKNILIMYFIGIGTFPTLCRLWCMKVVYASDQMFL